MRTLRSKAARALLYYSQDGKCALCGDDLPDSWHADHIVPYSVTGRTNVFEMQALCPACNLKKGAKVDTDSTRYRWNQRQARPGQRDSVHKILEGLRRRDEFIPIILPTGYGKTSIIWVSSIMAYRLGLTSVSLVASPNTILQKQVIADKTAEDTVPKILNRFEITDRSDIKYSLMDDVKLGMPFNGDILMSATIQLLTQPHQIKLLKKWVESILFTTNQPPLLHIDEAHTGSTDNTWGSLAQRWRKAGGIVVLYTATPERHDNIEIPGIPLKTVDVEPVQYLQISRGSTPELIKKSLYVATRQQVMLDMDYVQEHGVFVPYRTAWEEDILCHIQRIPFDVDLTKVNIDDINNDGDVTKLSELSESKTRILLGKIVRDHEVIDAGVRTMIRELALKRKVVPDCAAIVFCANDNDPGKVANVHAKAIKQTINRLAPELKVVIATSATGEDDTVEERQGIKLIEEFKDSGDVLIVKQMASVGLDIPRLKVTLDLSAVRTVPSCMQRWNRMTRPHEGLLVSSLITPDDCLGNAIFERYVVEENGHERLVDKQKIWEEEQPKKEPPPEDIRAVTGAGIGGLVDTKGSHEDGEMYEPAIAFLEEVPPIGATYTHNDIIRALRNIGATVSDRERNNGGNTGDQVYPIRQDCTDLVQSIVRKIMRHDPFNQELKASTYKDVWRRARVRAGIPPGLKLDDTRDLVQIRRLKNVLTVMEREVSNV